MVGMRIATISEEPAIAALLESQYAQSDEVSLRNEHKIRWTNASDSDVILVVVILGRIVSTMRGTVVATSVDAEGILQRPLDSANVNFPALVLSRAATQASARRNGYSSLLRYCFIRACVDTSIKTVIGAMNSTAPRIPDMKRMGYRFSMPEPHEPAFLKLHAPSLSVVAMLDCTHFARAIDHLATQQSDTLRQAEWLGELLTIPHTD